MDCFQILSDAEVDGLLQYSFVLLTLTFHLLVYNEVKPVKPGLNTI